MERGGVAGSGGGIPAEGPPTGLGVMGGLGVAAGCCGIGFALGVRLIRGEGRDRGFLASSAAPFFSLSFLPLSFSGSFGSFVALSFLLLFLGSSLTLPSVPFFGLAGMAVAG